MHDRPRLWPDSGLDQPPRLVTEGDHTEKRRSAVGIVEPAHVDAQGSAPGSRGSARRAPGRAPKRRPRVEQRDAIAGRGQREVVRGQHDRRRAAQAVERAQERGLARRIEVIGRLVEQEQARTRRPARGSGPRAALRRPRATRTSVPRAARARRARASSSTRAWPRSRAARRARGPSVTSSRTLKRDGTSVWNSTPSMRTRAGPLGSGPPSQRIAPPSTGSRPASARSSVVLPASVRADQREPLPGGRRRG